ncbi:hypothetical protein J4E80_010892 [Alternaria sp. BMP 0032]|nr:hypothetical protein J4E80_010892 [Alternaria sp. BMP 0032]
MSTLSELLDISDPIITAVEIATQTGHTNLLMKSIATTIESKSNTGDGIDASDLCTQHVENERLVRGANSIVSQEPRARTTPPGLPRITPDIDVGRLTEAVPTRSLQSFQSVQLRRQTSLENIPSTSNSQSEAGHMAQASPGREAGGGNPSAASSELPHAKTTAMTSTQTQAEETISKSLGSVLAHQTMRHASPTDGKWPNVTATTEGRGNMVSLPLRPQTPYDSQSIPSDWDDDMASNQQPGLYDVIYEKLVRSEFSRAKFLPQDDFDELLTEETIKEELDKFAPRFARRSLIEYISKYARKTFAILVIQAKVHKAVNLETTTFKDEYLPIDNEDSCLTSLSGVSKDLPGWRWFRSWTKQEKNDFCDQQWLYLVPVFGDDSEMEELHPDCRLPFLKSQSKGEGGSFSFLHQATIHHAHHAVNSVSMSILCYQDFAHLNRTI